MITNVITTLLSSSESNSSSSEEESSDEFEELCLVYAKTDLGRKKIRLSNFYEEVVEKYCEEAFCQNFRISKSTANMIVEKYENSTFFKTKSMGGIKEIPAKIQMLSFLWFSANKDSYREVCNLFGQSESTFYKHLNLILDFFVDVAKNLIHFPETRQEKEKLARSFQQISGFINVLGCIDGCYIYIRQPANKIRSTYVNRHDLLSITLQGICDSNKRFMDVCIGAPSKVHDARIFSISPISKELPVLCEGKFHLLGDAAYTLREYLLTPYKDYGTLSPRRRRYNIKHSQTRVKIENAFGLLKQRFRQLIRLDFFDTERASKFVLACCVLHNICIDMDDSLPERIAIDMNENLPGVRQYDDENSQRSTALKLLGEAKRSEIVNIIT
ncbi:putative nuclease HARBI1 [Malaya genurostris]|uniref:putative nuclease HARBI1 n=1 Tax=Malaya genurostris TaxID=325434 RepID=UPI0026F3DC46|nr:putative nuclease HARBI1 [Malaya genurostris]